MIYTRRARSIGSNYKPTYFDVHVRLQTDQFGIWTVERESNLRPQTRQSYTLAL